MIKLDVMQMLYAFMGAFVAIAVKLVMASKPNEY